MCFQFSHFSDHKEHDQIKNKGESTKTPLILTYNQTLPNFSKVIINNCNLLKINNKLKHVFEEKPFISYP